MKKLFIVLFIVLFAVTAFADPNQTIVQMDNRESGPRFGATYTGTVADGVNSNSVEIPNWGYSGYRLTAAVIAGAGTAVLYYTLSSKADVIAGTADWLPWGPGEVTGSVASTLTTPVTFIYCDSTGGAITFYLQM